MPVVFVANQELFIQFSDYSSFTFGDIVNFSSIGKDKFPVRVPFYNVGAGIARNCQIEWDNESVEKACLSLKDKLAEISPNLAGTYHAYNGILYCYDFESRDEHLSSIECWGDGSGGISYSVLTDMIQYPYLLPVTMKEPIETLALSQGLSALLIEAVNQEIDSLPTVNMEIRYEDMTGKKYSIVYEISFSVSGVSSGSNYKSALLQVSAHEKKMEADT